MSQLMKYLCYAVWLILLQCLQFSPQKFIEISGAYPMLTLLLVVFVAANEGNFAGSIFGALAGAMSDIYSTSGSGFHALLFLTAGFICGYFCEYVLQRNYFAVVMLSFAVPLIISLIQWLFESGSMSAALFMNFYFPNVIYTFLLSIPLYGIFKITTGNRVVKSRFLGIYRNGRNAWKPTPPRRLNRSK
jgi:rod shape-determining protein MreD